MVYFGPSSSRGLANLTFRPRWEIHCPSEIYENKAPLDAIASCDIQRIDRADDGAVWTVSPGERTNVLIALKEVTALRITAFGSPREISKRRFALYVDQPAAFVEAVSRAMASGLRRIAA